MLSGIPASRVPAIPATAIAAHSPHIRISIRNSQPAEPSSAAISAGPVQLRDTAQERAAGRPSSSHPASAAAAAISSSTPRFAQ